MHIDQPYLMALHRTPFTHNLLGPIAVHAVNHVTIPASSLFFILIHDISYFSPLSTLLFSYRHTVDHCGMGTEKIPGPVCLEPQHGQVENLCHKGKCRVEGGLRGATVHHHYIFTLYFSFLKLFKNSIPVRKKCRTHAPLHHTLPVRDVQ